MSFRMVQRIEIVDQDVTNAVVMEVIPRILGNFFTKVAAESTSPVDDENFF